jgi:sugar O-acyltransferase (sialic acid O-acetyltransferase NeuD family)
MKENFVIIGAGGFAREVLDIFEACREAGQGREVVGYLVEAPYGLPGTMVNDKLILGDLSWLTEHASEVRAICAVGDPAVRKRLVARAQGYGARFGNIIHPSAILTRHVTMGEGIVIAAGCIFTNQIRVGDHVHVNLASTIGHNAEMNDFVTLAPGVRVSGWVTLEEGCYVGSGANIVDKRTVGAWSVIGAGSVVITDIPPHSTALGVPARVIKRREHG